MHRNPSRPLSPHLRYWRWGPHMVVSILHRMTGVGLSTVGVIAFVWWLVAAASGTEAYKSFTDCATSWWATVIWIGLSWAVIQHSLSGIRHFVMDIGAGFELTTNRMWAWATLLGSPILTFFLWYYIVGAR
jgi:succinate dehydrogenase / fumarate reductase cytochrome b subunit